MRAALILLLGASVVLGQSLPTAQECQAKSDSIGQNALLQQLSACTSTPPSAACCSAANGLLGFPGSGQLAGCLCNAAALETTLSTVESNSLARLAGVTRQGVQDTLNSCKVPNVNLAGSCPSGGAAATTTPAATTNPAATTGTTQATAAASAKTSSGLKHPLLGGGLKHPLLGGGLAAGALSGGALGGGGLLKHHPILSSIVSSKVGGRRLLNVEIKAPGAAVAVSKAAVDVKAPFTSVEIKKPVEEAAKVATAAKAAVDVKADAVAKVVAAPKAVKVDVAAFHKDLVKQAVAVHAAITKSITDAVTAKLGVAVGIHKAKADAVASVFAKSG